MFACAFDTFSEYLAVTRLLKVYSLTRSFFKSSPLFLAGSCIYFINKKMPIISQNIITMEALSETVSSGYFNPRSVKTIERNKVIPVFSYWKYFLLNMLESVIWQQSSAASLPGWSPGHVSPPLHTGQEVYPPLPLNFYSRDKPLASLISLNCCDMNIIGSINDPKLEGNGPHQ